ncbi:MAG: hypothetical protein ABIH03_11245 [Pseudomonadota bacterium]
MTIEFQKPAESAAKRLKISVLRSDVCAHTAPQAAGYYEDVFQQVGNVAMAEGENREQYMKFKYWAGRNWRIFERLRKQICGAIQNMLKPDPAYAEFLRRREEILAQCADKDADGDPKLWKSDDGKMRFVLSFDGEKKAEALVETLRKEFQTAVDDRLAHEEYVTNFLAQEIEVEIFTVPWDWAPSRISGAYLQAVAVMCPDCPQEETT